MNGIKGTAKRLCCWLLAGILLTGQGSLSVYAAGSPLLQDTVFESYGLKWKVQLTDSGRDMLICMGPVTGTTVSGRLEIPTDVEYEGYTYWVGEIEQGAFAYCTELTEVVIKEGNGTFIIGENEEADPDPGVFEGCVNLRRAVIPNSCRSIGLYTFRSCNALENVEFEAPRSEDKRWGPIEICSCAFEGCTALREISLSNCISLELKDKVFNNCSRLTKVTLSDRTNISGNCIFNGCKELRTLKIAVNTPREGAAWSTAYVRKENAPFESLPDNESLPGGRKLVFLNSAGTAVLSGSTLADVQTAYRAADDGDTTDNNWYGWEISGVELYPIELTVKKDGELWANSGKSFELSANGTDFIPYEPGNTSVMGGTYRVYETTGSEAGRIDTKVDITVDEDYTTGAPEINYYTLEISAGTGGTVTPGNNVSVRHGEDQIVIITPDLGYYIKQILIDGAAVLDADLAEKDSYTYNFSDVKERHKIEVTFEADSEEPNIPGSTDTPEEPNKPGTSDIPIAPDCSNASGSGTPQTPDSSAPGASAAAEPLASGSGTSGNNTAAGQSRDPRTGDGAPVELYVTLAMIAGLTEVMLYFARNNKGMTEEKKKELVASLVSWARHGGRLRRYAALAVICGLLLYYHSFGKHISGKREVLRGA